MATDPAPSTRDAGQTAGVRSRLAPAAKTALLRTGGYAFVRRLLPSRGVAILRYHAICGAEGYRYASPGICISPDAFDAHVAYLADHYAVLPLADVVARLRDRRPLPANAVSITFDDGYADNLEAARTLHRHGVEATFFLTAGCLAGGAPFWPAEIRTLIPAIPGASLPVDAGGTRVELPLGDPSQRERSIRIVTKLIKTLSIPDRDALREQLRAAAGHPAMPPCMLSWAEVAEMQRLGMTMGAHTLTHPNLPSAGLPAATQEIEGSKTRLERELGVPVALMSYPNGGAERYYTPELQKVVASLKFRGAASSRNAFAGSKSDVYALERIEVEERLEDLVFALEVERFLFKPADTGGGVRA